jgi:hypothetical protein
MGGGCFDALGRASQDAYNNTVGAVIHGRTHFWETGKIHARITSQRYCLYR